MWRHILPVAVDTSNGSQQEDKAFKFPMLVSTHSSESVHNGKSQQCNQNLCATSLSAQTFDDYLHWTIFPTTSVLNLDSCICVPIKSELTSLHLRIPRSFLAKPSKANILGGGHKLVSFLIKQILFLLILGSEGEGSEVMWLNQRIWLDQTGCTIVT